MEHVKKMVLMDPRVLESLPQHAPTPPLVTALANSNRGMSQALHARGLTDEERLDEYRRELATYRNLQVQHATRAPVPVRLVGREEPPAATPAPPDASIGQSPLTDQAENAVQSIPKNYQRHARLILRHMQRHPGATFNERDELVFGGQRIPGSNIVDLVNHVVRPHKQRGQVAMPPGSDAFAAVLQRLNVPREAIGNRYYTQPSRFADDDNDDDDDDEVWYEGRHEDGVLDFTPQTQPRGPLDQFRDYKM
jgi:hypothetical protein